MNCRVAHDPSAAGGVSEIVVAVIIPEESCCPRAVMHCPTTMAEESAVFVVVKAVPAETVTSREVVVGLGAGAPDAP
jgi:hypothetical protein